MCAPWEPPVPQARGFVSKNKALFLCDKDTWRNLRELPSPPWESCCQKPLPVPGRGWAEGACAGAGGRGREEVVLLPGTCYFGPSESLFLLGLHSTASDKTPLSDLFALTPFAGPSVQRSDARSSSEQESQDAGPLPDAESVLHGCPYPTRVSPATGTLAGRPVGEWITVGPQILEAWLPPQPPFRS